MGARKLLRDDWVWHPKAKILVPRQRSLLIPGKAPFRPSFIPVRWPRIYLPPVMGSAYRSHSTVASGTRSNTQFTAPSPIVDGDSLVILMSAGADPAVTITAHAGFATLAGFPVDVTFPPDTFVSRVTAFIKSASGEAGNYDTTHGSATSMGLMYAISGPSANPINPSPAITDHAAGSGGTIVIAPTISPAVNSSFVIWGGHTWDEFGAATPPTGSTPTFTERHNTSTEPFYVADGVLETAGDTGAKSVTSTQADDRPWAAYLIVVEAGVPSGKHLTRTYRPAPFRPGIGR